MIDGVISLQYAVHSVFIYWACHGPWRRIESPDSSTGADKIIVAVLTQETEDKECVITYISRRLIDEETRYTLTEKLCLSLLCLYQIEALSTI